ncbi:MAG: hypothetical protein Q9219_004888 [cf. Caloplaca sp. 3 TL-2023]
MMKIPLLLLVSVSTFIVDAFPASDIQPLTLPESDGNTSSTTNATSYGTPLRPSIDLFDIDFKIKQYPNPPSPFNPTYQFFNLYLQLVHFWRKPTITPITELRRIPAVKFHCPDTWIQPFPGTQYLTTAVAASVLIKILAVIDSTTQLHFVPYQIAVRLTTEHAGAPIGYILSSWTGNPDLGPRDEAITRTATAPDETLGDGSVTTRVLYLGQSPQYRTITPQLLLTKLRLTTEKMLSNRASDHIIFDPRQPSIINIQQNTQTYELFSQINATGAPPRGRFPMTWDELATGMVMVLLDVVTQQRFEPLRAEIYVDGWRAATYGLYFRPRIRDGIEGGVEIS